MNSSGPGFEDEDDPTAAASAPDQGSDTGLGGTPHGPSFTFGEPAWREPVSDPTRPSATGPPATGSANARRSTPPTSRLPGLLTALALLVVVTVTVVATVLADRRDSTVAGPSPSPVVVPSATTAGTSTIEFTGSVGSGRLSVLNHSWDPSGSPATADSFVRLEVELVCTTGEVEYDPVFFQAFDFRGDLYDVSPDDPAVPQLGIGTLRAGESVRGLLGFELPRGEMTLLMSSDSSGAVTAIRIPD
ncbi:MAG TPA: hypothetical protein VFP89_08640 [Propionibacteriaceae bacterium]|nr:hypothetical protein [Propionibacteriaceae bacterium]